MCHGRAIIATAHSGINDIIEHNETGYMVNEKDIDQMSKYMLELSENDLKAESMGKAGRTRIQKVGDVEQQASKLLKHLKYKVKNV